jgi:DNA-binding PucR family transcriptional regulator
MDYDGVIDGDQGKSRNPWDHNRDYDGNKRGFYVERGRHHHKDWWYLCIHAYVYTPDGKFLIQRRSLEKRYFPGIWDITCGAADMGEDSLDAAIREVKEELGLDVLAGVGQIVKELKDVAASYTGAENALRYADVFEISGNVHTYREFILVRMLEDVPANKCAEYLSEITDEQFKEVFEDEEMLSTAEAFLQSSLNVSETSRNLYMHRNTLLYRLDKIEKATGLNVRLFSDAVSFRVLTVLYKLLKK